MLAKRKPLNMCSAVCGKILIIQVVQSNERLTCLDLDRLRKMGKVIRVEAVDGKLRFYPNPANPGIKHLETSPLLPSTQFHPAPSLAMEALANEPLVDFMRPRRKGCEYGLSTTKTGSEDTQRVLF